MDTLDSLRKKIETTEKGISSKHVSKKFLIRDGQKVPFRDL